MSELQQIADETVTKYVRRPHGDEAVTVLLLARDVPRDEIARQQHYSRSYLDNRIARLMRRYGVRTNARLVIVFIKHGWIRLEDV